MFPGTPAKEEIILAAGNEVLFAVKRLHGVFQNHTTNSDLVVRVPKNNLGLYNDIGDEISIFVRKVDNYFPFKFQKISDSEGPLSPSSPGRQSSMATVILSKFEIDPV